jgi:hypothetical protein
MLFLDLLSSISKDTCGIIGSNKADVHREKLDAISTNDLASVYWDAGDDDDNFDGETIINQLHVTHAQP